MTTIIEEIVACAVCGTKTQLQTLGSTNQFGSSDLDLRPPNQARSTMHLWLQRCQGCGMVASRLDKAETKVAELLKSPDYLSALADRTVPEPASQFVCRSLIDEALHRYRDAFSSILSAAWVADDMGLDDAARDFRTRAAALLGQEPDLENEDKLRLLDVLRRAGQWTEAASLAEDLASAHLDHPLGEIVAYQKRLIGERERGCRTVEQAMAGFQPSGDALSPPNS